MSTEYLNNKSFEGIIAKFQRSKREKIRFELIIADIRESLSRKARKTSRDVDVLSLMLASFEKAQNEHRESQKQLAAAFYTLSENIVKYAKFNLIDADDAIQEGVMICFEKIDRFDPKKGKAFNYMTTCILNHFRQLYRTARNYNELKRKYLDFLQSQLNSSILKNGKEINNFKDGKNKIL